MYYFHLPLNRHPGFASHVLKPIMTYHTANLANSVMRPKSNTIQQSSSKWLLIQTQVNISLWVSTAYFEGPQNIFCPCWNPKLPEFQVHVLFLTVTHHLITLLLRSLTFRSIKGCRFLIQYLDTIWIFNSKSLCSAAEVEPGFYKGGCRSSNWQCRGLQRPLPASPFLPCDQVVRPFPKKVKIFHSSPLCTEACPLPSPLPTAVTVQGWRELQSSSWVVWTLGSAQDTASKWANSSFLCLLPGWQGIPWGIRPGGRTCAHAATEAITPGWGQPPTQLDWSETGAPWGSGCGSWWRGDSEDRKSNMPLSTGWEGGAEKDSYLLWELKRSQAAAPTMWSERGAQPPIALPPLPRIHTCSAAV